MQANLKGQSSDFVVDGLEGLQASEESLKLAGTAGSTTPSQDWTVEETAKVLGLSRGAVIRRLEDGILPGYRVKRGHSSVWRVKAIWQEQKNGYPEAHTTIESPATQSKDEDANLMSFDPTQDDSLDETHVASPEGRLDENPDPIHNAKQKMSQERIELDNNEPDAGDGNFDLVEVYEADEETENSSAIPLSTYKELIELRTKLALAETQFQETKEKLETATHKIGYLEARIDFGQEQLKLLADSKHKLPWWQRLFFGHSRS